MRDIQRIAFIGFGEAGSILGGQLAARGRDVVTYDILLDSAGSRAALQAKARAARVQTADTQAAAMEGASLVISAVTASSATAVAAQATRSIRAGQISESLPRSRCAGVS